MTNEEFETRKKEVASNLQLLLDDAAAARLDCS